MSQELPQCLIQLVPVAAESTVKSSSPEEGPRFPSFCFKGPVLFGPDCLCSIGQVDLPFMMSQRDLIPPRG